MNQRRKLMCAAEKCNLINVCAGLRRSGTSFTLFTGGSERLWRVSRWGHFNNKEGCSGKRQNITAAFFNTRTAGQRRDCQRCIQSAGMLWWNVVLFLIHKSSQIICFRLSFQMRESTLNEPRPSYFIIADIFISKSGKLGLEPSKTQNSLSFGRPSPLTCDGAPFFCVSR